jgi:hypothetical protein
MKPAIFLDEETGKKPKKKQKKKRKKESIVINIIIIIIINLLVFYFLSTFSRTILTVVLLWILLVPVKPPSKLETSPPVMSVMSEDIDLQQGVSRLQTASADLWIFSINTISLEDTFSFA